MRAPCWRMKTEAVGSGASRLNSSRSGSTRWTRAWRTPLMVAMVRAKFALQRAQPVDVLDEIGCTEAVGLIEDLIAERSAGGQARLGHGKAQPVDLVGGNHDRRSLARHLVGDAQLVELCRDVGGIGHVEIAVEQRHVGLRQPGGQEDEKRDHRQADGADGGQSGRAECAKGLKDRVQRRPRRFWPEGDLPSLMRPTLGASR